MRHTQLFAYLILLAAKEWPLSKSKLTPGQVEMFYHCVSSDTYPDCIDKTGQPAGLNVSNTRLTAYNDTQNTPLWIT